MAEKNTMAPFWVAITASIATSLIIMAGLEYIVDHSNDESGTIVSKQNYEIAIDIDGDAVADRVIKFFYWDEENRMYYNYARVGDKISYSNNSRNKNVVWGIRNRYNKIRKINGTKAKKILEQNGTRVR